MAQKSPFIRQPSRGTIHRLIETVNKFYEDPENDRKFREWYEKKYGHPYKEEKR